MTDSGADELTPTARWMVAAAVVSSAAVCVYSIRQVDPDLYGYLAYGRLFLHEGLGTPDPFAYTSSGSHWVAFEYLAQMLLWVSYRAFGPMGLIGLKCIVGGLAIGFLWFALRTLTGNLVVLVPVFLFTTSTVSRFFLFRPQLFTFMFFALYVALLFRFLARGAAPLWLLPLTMLVWANVHGGFLAGLAAMCLALALRVSQSLFTERANGSTVWRGTRPLWLALAACFAVTAVNPQGLRLWQYVSTEVLHGTNRAYIAEWQPVGLDRDPWSAAALAFMTIMLVVVGWMAQAANRRVAGLPPWVWLISAIPAIVLASLSVRHVPLAALWLAPLIAALAASILPSLHSPRAAAFNAVWIVVGGCSLVPIVITVNYVIANPRPVIAAGGSFLGDMNPCTAVAFMKGARLRGNLYVPLWWGAFVTWEMYPDIRVSMDGRNISLYSREMVEENLHFYSNEVTREELRSPKRYDTDFLIVPANLPALELVRADLDWREVFSDSQASVFVLADSNSADVRPSIDFYARSALSECSRTLR